MKRKGITPSYYKNFLCKGSECSENCCIGWKIEIDVESLERYAKVGGELGDELCENIIRDGESSHFCLKNGRCAFLDENNLCRLISSFGEDILCDICREHPRFYINFPKGGFLGVGLCCEAAAELVLSEKNPVGYGLCRPEIMRAALSFVDRDGEIYDADIYQQSLESLKKIEQTLSAGADPVAACELILDSSRSLQAKIDESLYGIASDILPDGGPSDGNRLLGNFILRLSELEYLTDEIRRRLSRVNIRDAAEFYKSNPEFLGYLGRCIIYFADRYLPGVPEDMDSTGRGNLVLSLSLVLCLLLTTVDEVTVAAAQKICTLVSRELEYNEDNAELLREFDSLAMVEIVKMLGLGNL